MKYKQYEEIFQRSYQSIHRFAVRHQGEPDFDHRLIGYIGMEQAKVFAALDQLERVGHVGTEDGWRAQEEAHILTAFHPGNLFGIWRGQDGHIYGGDDKGDIIIKDREAWEAAEQFEEQRKRIREEAAKRERKPTIKR